MKTLLTIIRRSTNILVFLITSFITVSFSSKAHAYVELNGFYFSDALSTAASKTNSRMLFDFSAGFAVDKKNQFLVGWNYSMHNTSDAATATETYASTQMGPRFVWNIDKDFHWNMGLGYYLVSQAAHDDGAGGTATWKGTALKFDFGYNFPVASDIYMGIRFNYSSASYKEKLVNSTTYSEVSYTRVMMYPSIYSIWVF